MTHSPVIETLVAYFVGPERKAIATWKSRDRTRSRKIRRGPGSAMGQLQHDGASVGAADFSDPESERVLDAIADALLEPLALQAAREDDEAEWLASQQGRL